MLHTHARVTKAALATERVRRCGIPPAIVDRGSQAMTLDNGLDRPSQARRHGMAPPWSRLLAGLPQPPSFRASNMAICRDTLYRTGPSRWDGQQALRLHRT